MPRLRYVDLSLTLFDRQGELQTAQLLKIQAVIDKERQFKGRQTHVIAHVPRSRPRKDLVEPSGVLSSSEDCVGGHPDLFGAPRAAPAVQAAPPFGLNTVLQSYPDGPLTGDVLQALQAAKYARCRESWADVAREMGMSRQHLANARMGRYGLSPENAAKLKSWLLSA